VYEVQNASHAIFGYCDASGIRRARSKDAASCLNYCLVSLIHEKSTPLSLSACFDGFVVLVAL
jgi:hypothetical protein